jgi:transcription elongation factor Elf1
MIISDLTCPCCGSTCEVIEDDDRSFLACTYCDWEIETDFLDY